MIIHSYREEPCNCQPWVNINIDPIVGQIFYFHTGAESCYKHWKVSRIYFLNISFIIAWGLMKPRGEKKACLQGLWGKTTALVAVYLLFIHALIHLMTAKSSKVSLHSKSVLVIYYAECIFFFLFSFSFDLVWGGDNWADSPPKRSERWHVFLLWNVFKASVRVNHFQPDAVKCSMSSSGWRTGVKVL